LICAVVENLGLLLIAAVSTYEHRPTHEKAFLGWLIAMLVHLITYNNQNLQKLCPLLTLRYFRFLPTFYMARSPLSKEEVTSFKLRIIFSVLQVACLILAGYFFVRHNRYCENGSTQRMGEKFGLWEVLLTRLSLQCIHSLL